MARAAFDCDHQLVDLFQLTYCRRDVSHVSFVVEPFAGEI